MVRIDVFPGPAYGASAIGGCCNTGVEQLISISSTAAFPTSGMKTGAGVSTAGLWHYPATITNATIATEFASFGPAAGFPDKSTAGVINNIDGRQQVSIIIMILHSNLLTLHQMVFFIGFATEWSSTSNYLQHAWITWATRGLCMYACQDHEHSLILQQTLVSVVSSSATKVSLKQDILQALRLINTYSR